MQQLLLLRSASDIVLTEPGLSVIISAVLTHISKNEELYRQLIQVTAELGDYPWLQSLVHVA